MKTGIGVIVFIMASMLSACISKPVKPNAADSDRQPATFIPADVPWRKCAMESVRDGTCPELAPFKLQRGGYKFPLDLEVLRDLCLARFKAADLKEFNIDVSSLNGIFFRDGFSDNGVFDHAALHCVLSLNGNIWPAMQATVAFGLDGVVRVHPIIFQNVPTIQYQIFSDTGLSLLMDPDFLTDKDKQNKLTNQVRALVPSALVSILKGGVILGQPVPPRVVVEGIPDFRSFVMVANGIRLYGTKTVSNPIRPTRAIYRQPFQFVAPMPLVWDGQAPLPNKIIVPETMRTISAQYRDSGAFRTLTSLPEPFGPGQLVKKSAMN